MYDPIVLVVCLKCVKRKCWGENGPPRVVVKGTRVHGSVSDAPGAVRTHVAPACEQQEFHRKSPGVRGIHPVDSRATEGTTSMLFVALGE